MRTAFVVPARNEAANLPELVREIAATLDALGGEGEMWIVDDASQDASLSVLQELQRRERRLRILRARRPVGQSAALALGFAHARADVVVTLDADLQNDPRDALKLVAALHGADLVCGVRVGRRDSLWRRLVSRVAFRLRNAFLHDEARDTGCGLKAFRAEALRRLVRFDGWHRFFPALARREGLEVVEVEVSHRPRRHGRTHYGTWGRARRSAYDLLGMTWLVARRMPGAEAAEELPGASAADRLES